MCIEGERHHHHQRRQQGALDPFTSDLHLAVLESSADASRSRDTERVRLVRGNLRICIALRGWRGRVEVRVGSAKVPPCTALKPVQSSHGMQSKHSMQSQSTHHIWIRVEALCVYGLADFCAGEGGVQARAKELLDTGGDWDGVCVWGGDVFSSGCVVRDG